MSVGNQLGSEVGVPTDKGTWAGSTTGIHRCNCPGQGQGSPRAQELSGRYRIVWLSDVHCPTNPAHWPEGGWKEGRNVGVGVGHWGQRSWEVQEWATVQGQVRGTGLGQVQGHNNNVGTKGSTRIQKSVCSGSGSACVQGAWATKSGDGVSPTTQPCVVPGHQSAVVHCPGRLVLSQGGWAVPTVWHKLEAVKSAQCPWEVPARAACCPSTPTHQWAGVCPTHNNLNSRPKVPTGTMWAEGVRLSLGQLNVSVNQSG